MGIRYGLDIYESLRRWSSETPRQANPQEPVLLAKPSNYPLVHLTQGLVIVKGLYGYGKTYGYGLNLYHEAKTTEKFDTVYINLREVTPHLTSLSKDATDIIRAFCAQNLVNKEGVYLTTNPKLVSDICNTITPRREPVESLREFLLTLAAKADKKVFLVIDELERLGERWGRAPRESVYEMILNTLLALRPGVMDTYPNKLTVVYLVQEVMYPSDKMRRELSQSVIPALGRMFVATEDGSIPTEYDLKSYMGYIDNALNALAKAGVDEGLLRDIRQMFYNSDVTRRIEKYLVNMPAFIAFDIINKAIRDAVTGDHSVEYILDSYINAVPIFKLYGGSRVGFTSQHIVNALAMVLSDIEPETYPGKVFRIGYEGVYTVKETKEKKRGLTAIIIVARFSDLRIRDKDVEKYRKEFARLYGDVLEKCIEPNAKCKIVLLHPKDVDVAGAVLALKKLIVGGKAINAEVYPYPLSYDHLFTLLVAANSDILVPPNVRAFIREKYESELKTIFASLVSV